MLIDVERKKIHICVIIDCPSGTLYVHTLAEGALHEDNLQVITARQNLQTPFPLQTKQDCRVFKFKLSENILKYMNSTY